MNKIAVVIPSYRVSAQILSVLSQIGDEVWRIYVVDDCCPEKSGQLVSSMCKDPRVKVIFHSVNQGVGGAMVTGYRAAMLDGAEIVVKIDGDGQMDPSLIPLFVEPISKGRADYVKGNRFFNLESLATMPKFRLFGNAGLSFLNKAASGYWNLMDPANGYTAIHAGVLALIPLEKIEKRYFFESDLLFRLNTLRAVVAEVPMEAQYADENSSLSISRVAMQFPRKLLVRLLKRIGYNYFLRDFNVCSIELILGTLLVACGIAFGLFQWHLGSVSGIPATTGTVMLSALPVMLGFQLLLSAITFDVTRVPKEPLQNLISIKRKNSLVAFRGSAANQ